MECLFFMVFDKFLLFHPFSNLTYIRKLSMSYGYYTALAVVNSNDYVTHIGLDNDFHIVSFRDLSNFDKNVLGQERCSKLRDDDLLSVYRINTVLKLVKPFKLHRGCRSMRYTLKDETYYLKKIISESMDVNSPVVVNKDFNFYGDKYGENVVLDLNDLNLDMLDSVVGDVLPVFSSGDGKGQTRLV